MYLTKLAAVCLALSAAFPAWPADGAEDGTPLTRATIQSIVRSYLLEHPEILVEMSGALRKRQADSQREKAQIAIAARRSELLADAGSPVAGPASEAGGSVSLVAFFDYRCGYCKKVDPLLKKLAAEDPTLRIVFKEFPILGPESTFAALAALAAREQGGYLKFHYALMASTDLSREAVERIAVESGLDAERLKKDMAKPELPSALARNRSLADALEIQATPAFVIGGEVAPGALDEAALKGLIAKARAGAPNQPE